MRGKKEKRGKGVEGTIEERKQGCEYVYNLNGVHLSGVTCRLNKALIKGFWQLKKAHLKIHFLIHLHVYVRIQTSEGGRGLKGHWLTWCGHRQRGREGPNGSGRTYGHLYKVRLVG